MPESVGEEWLFGRKGLRRGTHCVSVSTLSFEYRRCPHHAPGPDTGGNAGGQLRLLPSLWPAVAAHPQPLPTAAAGPAGAWPSHHHRTAPAAVLLRLTRLPARHFRRAIAASGPGACPQDDPIDLYPGKCGLHGRRGSRSQIGQPTGHARQRRYAAAAGPPSGSSCLRPATRAGGG